MTTAAELYSLNLMLGAACIGGAFCTIMLLYRIRDAAWRWLGRPILRVIMGGKS